MPYPPRSVPLPLSAAAASDELPSTMMDQNGVFSVFCSETVLQAHCQRVLLSLADDGAVPELAMAKASMLIGPAAEVSAGCPSVT